ncbi:MAG: hypothetical protein ABI402_19630 [Ferruginibacter sp.]
MEVQDSISSNSSFVAASMLPGSSLGAERMWNTYIPDLKRIGTVRQKKNLQIALLQ